MWPVPIVNGRSPVISHELEAGPRYLPDGKLNYATHLGLDLMFARIPTDPIGPADSVAMFKHGTNPGYITWPGIMNRAVGPGHVWNAGLTALGWSVEVDHGQVDGVGLITFYQHMTHLVRPWKRGDAILPGTELGEMGGDPSNEPHLRHLHFEVWLPDGKAHRQDWPVNPAPFLALWSSV